MKEENSQKLNELKDKAKAKTKDLSQKVISKENKEKINSFLTTLLIGFLKGSKSCIECLHNKVLPKINAKLNALAEAKDE